MKELPKLDLTPGHKPRPDQLAEAREVALKLHEVTDASIEDIQKEARIFVYKELKRINAGKKYVSKNSFAMLHAILKLLLAVPANPIVAETKTTATNADDDRAKNLLEKYKQQVFTEATAEKKVQPGMRIATA